MQAIRQHWRFKHVENWVQGGGTPTGREKKGREGRKGQRGRAGGKDKKGREKKTEGDRGLSDIFSDSLYCPHEIPRCALPGPGYWGCMLHLPCSQSLLSEPHPTGKCF